MNELNGWQIRWLDDVVDKDYDAAYEYLSLRMDEQRASRLEIDLFDQKKILYRRANDILRACEYNPLPLDDPGVERTLKKVKKGKALSPVLIVSFHYGAEIADGYHRVSLAYHMNPFSLVPCRIASLNTREG